MIASLIFSTHFLSCTSTTSTLCYSELAAHLNSFYLQRTRTKQASSPVQPSPAQPSPVQFSSVQFFSDKY